MRGVAVGRLALLVVVAAGLVGCTADRDGLTRVTYPRTAIPPVTQGPTGTNVTTPGDSPGNKGSLTADRLRLVDPCDLLDTAVLARFGTPDRNVGQDFDGCRNYMRDGRGESLSFSVRVGETLTEHDVAKATDRIGGFRARTSKVEGACFVTLVVEQVDPPAGVTLQNGYVAADPCPAAREVAAAMAQRLRSAATLRTPRRGSLLGLDPCALPGSLPGEAVPGAIEPDPFGLHLCSWRNSGGAEIELEFGYRVDPVLDGAGQRRDQNGARQSYQTGTPVVLGAGVIGHLERFGVTFPTCQLGWLHLPGSDNQGDVVEIEARDVGDTGLDVCVAAVRFAEGLIPKLPKP